MGVLRSLWRAAGSCGYWGVAAIVVTLMALERGWQYWRQSWREDA
jgi:hypothetical protein